MTTEERPGDVLRRRCECGCDARFWARVEKADCWLWLGPTLRGYGRASLHGKSTAAHRYAYETLVGLIPPGLTIDHLCRVRNCVNPSHMEPVTNAENNARGTSPTALNALKTRCKWGHEFTEKNTYVDPKGGRHCRRCHYLRQARYATAARLARRLPKGPDESCESPWFIGLTCDHLFADCPNRRRSEEELRRVGWWDNDKHKVSTIDPHGSDVCGMCLHRHNQREHTVPREASA